MVEIESFISSQVQIKRFISSQVEQEVVRFISSQVEKSFIRRQVEVEKFIVSQVEVKSSISMQVKVERFIYNQENLERFISSYGREVYLQRNRQRQSCSLTFRIFLLACLQLNRYHLIFFISSLIFRMSVLTRSVAFAIKRSNIGTSIPIYKNSTKY